MIPAMNEADAAGAASVPGAPAGAASRTLVVSDLHLGMRLQRDVLRHPAALAPLLAAVASADRLVLLGDTIELIEGRAAEAMAAAEPVVRALGNALGPAGEVVIVPGNHDRPLIAPWLDAHTAALTPSTPVPGDASPELVRVVEWLAPARVRVHYPGVWLADGIWATHGHYLDRHLLPDSATGIARGLLGRRPHEHATPADYEAGPHLTRLEAYLTGRLPRRLSGLLEDLAAALRAAAMSAAPPHVRSRVMLRLAPLSALALGVQMRRAAIPALVQVTRCLGVEAHTVIFGHVHRSGPGPDDDAARWRAPAGGPRILNTGSWVYEPRLLARGRPPHPYWPGGAVVLERAQARAVGLLEHVPSTDLQGMLAPTDPLPENSARGQR